MTPVVAIAMCLNLLYEEKEGMKMYLEEKIGNPRLFTGRKNELAYFSQWSENIRRKLSMSTAILSRRKTGKTALMQRLYNIIFEKDMGVIPFYFEVREGNQWFTDFSRDFCLTFIYQYIGFKTRNAEYVRISQSSGKSFAKARIAAREVGEYLIEEIDKVESLARDTRSGLVWDAVRDMPRSLAAQQGEFIVQMIDEFQFVNRFIFWDWEKTRHADDFAGTWLHTCEYKNAPLLVSGSWVGWLMNDLRSMLPGRFVNWTLEELPRDEAAEMVFRYSLIYDIPVSEDTAYLIAKMSEGNPFYISALFQSRYPSKSLDSEEGVRKTLEFETLHRDGIIRGTWLEYISSAFPRVNEKYAKDIVLYLSKHRGRPVPRDELKKHLGLDMPDYELDRKMDALLRSDIIEKDIQYSGVRDNIFDKVFRSCYADDIDRFMTVEAQDEYKALFEKLRERYKRLSGEHNRYKGAFAEFVISHHLTYSAHENSELFAGMIQDLPDDFRFAEYEGVRPYHSPPLHKPEFQLDIFADAADEEEYSLIWEVKYRETTRFSVSEAEDFLGKAEELLRLEGIRRYVLIVFSSAGFTGEASDWLIRHGIAWSEDARWVNMHLLKRPDAKR